MIYTYVDTPVGRLLVAAQDGRLKRILFQSGSRAGGPLPDWERVWVAPGADDLLGRTRRQLDEYFAGQRQRFELPLAPDTTPFQARVLEALQAIPYGETRSYKDIAGAVGNPRAVRAVGAANGSNPLPIVIPCHRVIGSSGALTGFGGGLDAKRFLLDLERSRSGLFGSA